MNQQRTALADRYINDRFLPDKAIDLLDEAGARLRIRRLTAPPELREFDEKILKARRDKESAIDAQDFEKAAALRDTEKQLINAKAQREQEWKAGDLDVVAEVNDELIAEVLAAATGIPVFKLTEEESARLLKMEDELHKRVIGQEQAIHAISQAIRRTRAGLKDPKRPGGSFIFAGPSGVGKTELSKTLAEFLFGDEDALIALDMSEFSEKHTVSRLFGSPPGYVGYDEGGQLTEKVRRRPFSVVLFDEVEKAHPDIFNSLLQILEDGRLTDSQGRMVDFKNTVIIMTTNLGTRDIAKGLNMGFAAGDDSKSSYEKMKVKVHDELKQHFRPEFLNRIDDIVVFHQLSREEITQIVDLMVDGLEKRLKDKDMGIELTQAAKLLLAERGYDPVLGARPLRRTIQREIEDVLSEKILFGDVLLELRVAFRRAFRHKADDLLVPLRIEVLERKVFEFELDGVHAKPVRQWGEDLECLARLRFALCLRHSGECSHVVQPVGQLDDENADVARHGDHHLANRLSRACFAVFHLVEFRHAIDKMPYFLAEVLGQLLQRVRGVLDSVVQQCGDDRRRRHAEIGENAGNSQWVGDVGLATAPRLPLVEFRSGLEGPPDDSGVTLRVELVDRLDERVEIGSEVEFDRRSPADRITRHASKV